MAGVNCIVIKLVALWKTALDHHYLPSVFLSISVIGSVLKSLQVFPKTYFSDRGNIINLYFVKVAWGWTLFLLLPFIILSNSFTKSWAFVLRRLSSVVVSTAIWYICTQSFFYIEEVTGACYESESVDLIQGEYTSKEACRRAGLQWRGYDISGHSFILTYSALIIAEEIAPMIELKKANIRIQGKKNKMLDLLYVSLNAIIVIWIWMFGCTSVYFHNIFDKFLGTMCAILGWYFTYKVWYPKSFSPGLPPQQQLLKQHA